jgi:hypothetical protein
MRAWHSIFPFLFIIIIVYASCEPFEDVSDVPEITFKSLGPRYTYLYDTLSEWYIPACDLVFDFIDGDADFGSPEGEHDTNVFILPFKKVDGKYDSVNADIYGRKYIIKDDEKLRRSGQYKTIKGEIKIQILYIIDPPFDTLKYDFYIVDRAGHKSNVESTTDIGF